MLKTMLLKIGRHFRSRSELTIKDILSDSIVQAVMDADGINPQTLKAELMGMAHQISARRTRPQTPRQGAHCRLAVGTTTRDGLPQEGA